MSIRSRNNNSSKKIERKKERNYLHVQRLIYASTRIYTFYKNILIMNLTWLFGEWSDRKRTRKKERRKTYYKVLDFLYGHTSFWYSISGICSYTHALARIFMTGFIRFSSTFFRKLCFGAQRTNISQKKQQQQKPKHKFTHFIIGHNLFTCRFSVSC